MTPDVTPLASYCEPLRCPLKPQSADVIRRDLIKGIAGAAAWPLAANAQQSGRVPLVGWLDDFDASDPLSQSVRAAIGEALATLGWVENRNLKVERRFGAADTQRMRVAAGELVALAPDVPGGASPTRALQQATQSIPIVFTGDAAVIGLVKNIGATPPRRGLCRGAKVADLPVQLPTKYQLVVNVKAAKAIGLTIPEAFLLQADELIE